jgi:hypothetical protein
MGLPSKRAASSWLLMDESRCSVWNCLSAPSAFSCFARALSRSAVSFSMASPPSLASKSALNLSRSLVTASLRLEPVELGDVDGVGRADGVEQFAPVGAECGLQSLQLV